MNIYGNQIGGNADMGVAVIDEAVIDESDRGKWQALLLEPVRPFRWVRRAEQPVEL